MQIHSAGPPLVHGADQVANAARELDRPRDAGYPAHPEQLQGGGGGAVGGGAGLAIATSTAYADQRDQAESACNIDGGDVLIVDDDPNGSTTCGFQKSVMSCDRTDCVVITDDRTGQRPTYGRGGGTSHTAAVRR